MGLDVVSKSRSQDGEPPPEARNPSPIVRSRLPRVQRTPMADPAGLGIEFAGLPRPRIVPVTTTRPARSSSPAAR